MTTVAVRVPMAPGMDARAITTEAVRIYLDCTRAKAKNLLAERGYSFDRNLTEDELKAKEIVIQLALPDDLVEQARQSTISEIANLPPELREFIFHGGAASPAIDPDEYDDYTRIVNLAEQLSPAERESYLEQTSVDTTNPEDLARSLEAYAAHLRERTAARERRLEAEAEIFGVWETAEPYLRAMKEADAKAQGEVPRGSGPWGDKLRKATEEYLKVLRQNGFDSNEEFGAAIREYANAYRDEAVLIAEESLNRAKHGAFETSQALADPDALKGLFDALAPAREMIAEAHKIRQDNQTIYEGATVIQTHLDRKYEVMIAALYDKAYAHVRSLNGDWPILGYGPDKWAYSVTRAGTPEQLKKALEGQLEDFDESIKRMHETLDEDPDEIWKLDKLIAHVNQETGMVPGSGADRAIGRQIEMRKDAELAGDLLIGGAAIAAGLVSGGSGTVAVLGGAAAVGLGSYQAWEEFRRYEVANAANDVNMLSKDPSIAWAVIALIGVGLDVAAVAAVFRQLPAMANTVRNVAREGEAAIEALEQTIRQAPELTSKAKSALIAAARARAAEAAAFDALHMEMNGGKAIALSTARQDQVVAEIAHSVHGSMRRGVDGIDQWVRTPEARALIGDFEKLSGEEMKALREAYLSARSEANALQAQADAVGASEAEVRAALSKWAKAPETSADDVAKSVTASPQRMPGPDDTIPDGRAIDDAAEGKAVPDPVEFDDVTEVGPLANKKRGPDPVDFGDKTEPGKLAGDKEVPDPVDFGDKTEVGPLTREDSGRGGLSFDDTTEVNPRPPGADDTIEDVPAFGDKTDVSPPPGGSSDAEIEDLARSFEDEITEVRPVDIPDPKGTKVVTDEILEDTDKWLEEARGVLRADSDAGTVAKLPADNEAEILKLYYAARETSPEREIGLMRNRKTGTWIIVQGTKGEVPWPKREALERMFGKDHPLFKDDAWKSGNWDIPFHTHPKKAGTAATGKHGRVPSKGDFSVIERAAKARGEIAGAQVHYTTPDGVKRAFFNYDPKTEKFIFGGPLPVRQGSDDWRFVILEFDSVEDYARRVYPLVGAKISGP